MLVSLIVDMLLLSIYLEMIIVIVNTQMQLRSQKNMNAYLQFIYSMNSIHTDIVLTQRGERDLLPFTCSQLASNWPRKLLNEKSFIFSSNHFESAGTGDSRRIPIGLTGG